MLYSYFRSYSYSIINKNLGKSMLGNFNSSNKQIY